MSTPSEPIVTTQLLIRKPAMQVYEAFVDPAITTRFWFTKSSGRLEQDREVTWEFEMYGASALVRVTALEPGSRIAIDWDDPPCPVEFTFTPHGNDTLVKISTWGFVGSDKEITAQALDTMGGFTFVLAGLKALLEHNVELNLVRDHHPA